MARGSSSPRVTAHTLLLLVSLYSVMSLLLMFSYPTPTPYSPYDTISSSHNLILSEVSPVFQYSAPLESVRMEITYLHTNETQVAVSILSESSTLLNVTNVTSISSFTMGAWRSQSVNFGLQVTRLGSDADVNITIQHWVQKNVNVYIVSPAYPILLIAMVFFSVSVYIIYRLVRVNSRSGGRVRFMARNGTAPVLLLLILGIIFLAPLTRGHLSLDFIPQLTPQVSYENYDFILSESSSSRSIELADTYPETETDIAFSVYYIHASTYPVSIQVSSNSEQGLVLSGVDIERKWWLSFTMQTNDSIDFTVQRIHEDVEISFTLIVSYSAYKVRADPLVPVLLAFAGGNLCVLAIVQGIRLDSNYRRERFREESSDPLPIQ